MPGTGARMITILASLGNIACTNISAGDDDVGGIRLYFALSADAGTAIATAYYSQRTGIAAGRIAVLVFLFFFRAIVILIVRDGQRAGAFGIGLFQTGVGTGAGTACCSRSAQCWFCHRPSRSARPWHRCQKPLPG